MRPKIVGPFLLPLLTVLVAACGLLTEPEAGELRVAADPPTLVLTNEGQRPIFYFVIEQELAPLVNWGACTDPDACDRVERGSDVRLDYESIAGYSPEAERVIVYWWHLVPKAGGGFRPDTIRAVGVEL